MELEYRHMTSKQGYQVSDFNCLNLAIAKPNMVIKKF